MMKKVGSVAVPRPWFDFIETPEEAKVRRTNGWAQPSEAALPPMVFAETFDLENVETPVHTNIRTIGLKKTVNYSS